MPETFLRFYFPRPSSPPPSARFSHSGVSPSSSFVDDRPSPSDAISIGDRLWQGILRPNNWNWRSAAGISRLSGQDEGGRGRKLTGSTTFLPPKTPFPLLHSVSRRPDSDNFGHGHATTRISCHRHRPSLRGSRFRVISVSIQLSRTAVRAWSAPLFILTRFTRATLSRRAAEKYWPSPAPSFIPHRGANGGQINFVLFNLQRSAHRRTLSVYIRCTRNAVSRYE